MQFLEGLITKVDEFGDELLERMVERCIEKFQVGWATQHRVMPLFCKLLSTRGSKQLEQNKHRLEEDGEPLVFDLEHLLGRLCSLNWDGDLNTIIAWFKDVKRITSLQSNLMKRPNQKLSME